MSNKIIITNLFTDQLDRYGEIDDTIALLNDALTNLDDVLLILNADDPLSIDVIFSDSYKLTTVDTVQYTITSNSTDFYLSNTTEFIVRYDSTKGLYYFTIPITNTTNYVENNMYNIGMNFYTNNRLVTQTETSYYYVP